MAKYGTVYTAKDTRFGREGTEWMLIGIYYACQNPYELRGPSTTISVSRSELDRHFEEADDEHAAPCPELVS